MPYDHDDTDDDNNDNDHDHYHHRGDNGDLCSYNGDSSISGFLATSSAATAPISVAVHVVTTKVDVPAIGAIVVSVSVYSLDLLLTLPKSTLLLYKCCN